MAENGVNNDQGKKSMEEDGTGSNPDTEQFSSWPIQYRTGNWKLVVEVVYTFLHAQ